MELVLIRGAVKDLQQMVARARLPVPMYDKDNRPIGAVLRLWVEKGQLHADCECVPEDVANGVELNFRRDGRRPP